jgi:tetratricopeptide (TPR) repeat protein
MPVNPNPRKRLSLKRRRELDVQIEFMEGVIRRDRRYIEALQLLGDQYTERGRFADSLRVDRRLARLQPADPQVYYNLACSQSLNGRPDRALLALDKALSLGYTDFRWLARDPDLKAVREHPRYQRIRERIRRMRVKVT